MLGFAIAVTVVQQADMYMFDEPSSYLDVRQRLRAAHAIRDMCQLDNYVICVEHDLSVLDYLSDFVCCLYGKPVRITKITSFIQAQSRAHCRCIATYHLYFLFSFQFLFAFRVLMVS